MQVEKKVAQCVSKLAKKFVQTEAEKSSPLWLYEEPMPKEVTLCLKLNQSKKETG